MKTGIVIITYNILSDVFLLQIAAIEKFCKDQFTIIVIDNSSNEQLAENIKYHAGRLQHQYFRTYSGSKNSSDSHSFAANFAYQKFRNKYDYFLFLDHDCIPVKYFSVKDVLGSAMIGGIGQQKEKTYFWPGCLFINNSKIDKELVDFCPSIQHGLDTGGELYRVVEKYGEDYCVFFNESYHENPYFSGKHKSYAMINDEMFLHFIAGSNWDDASRHQERINSLINVTREKTQL